MITRDFLLRQIHQMAQALARVLFLKSSRQDAQAEQVIDETLRELPGLDALLDADLERAEVLALCRSESAFSPDKAVALADLLREKARLVEGEEASRRHLRHALWLYEAAAAHEGAVVPLDIHDRIAALKDELDSDGNGA